MPLHPLLVPLERPRSDPAPELAQRSQREVGFLAHALRSISECVTITDLDDRVLFVNDAFLRVYGYQRDEVLGRPVAFLKSERNPPGLSESVRAAALAGGWQGELWNRRRDGSEFPVYLSASAVIDERGEVTALVGVAADVSERHALEEQLRQAQKMEAVGELAGGVAHDFNNLLTAILGHAELLLARTPMGDPRRQELEEIRRSGERAADLTRQLLAFGRRQVLRPRLLEVNAVVVNLERMLRRLLGEHVELASSLAPDLAAVHADTGQLEQVIVNLCVNARDAMPGGGRLLIETRNVMLDDSYVRRHMAAKPGAHVLLSVSDDGCGMDAEVRARIFEPFFTTKEAGKGTGLGLSTVYGIVRQSGGFIWVYSEPGAGTAMKVYLPAVTGAVPAAPSPACDPRGLEGRETVLLVEDEPAVRAVAREALVAKGYRVVEAACGDEALAALGGDPGAFDLLLTDVGLPGRNGREVAEAARGLRPDLSVLFMSGYTEDAMLRNDRLPAGTMFLEKPFSPLALVSLVRSMLDRERGARRLTPSLPRPG